MAIAHHVSPLLRPKIVKGMAQEQVVRADRQQVELEQKAKDASKAMYSQILSLALFFGLNMVVKHFRLADPGYLLYTRVAFATGQAIFIGTLLLVQARIAAKADKTPVDVTVPAAPFSGQQPTKARVTAEEYDRQELSKALRGAIFQLALFVGIHYFFKSNQILIFQAILPLKNLLSVPLFRIHILGQPATGDLARPFVEPPSPFADLLKELQQPAGEAGAAVKDKDSDSESGSDASGLDKKPLLKDEPRIKVLSSSGSDTSSPSKPSSVKNRNGNKSKK